MKTLLISVFLIATSLAQSSAPQAGAAPNAAPAEEARFAEGTILRAELEKTIDAKKAKPGDPVVARTIDELRSESQVIAPKGVRIFGHVVEAAPRQGESPSTLGIAFDKMELGKGSEIPLKAVIQAAAKFESANLVAADSGGYSAPASGGAPSGRTGGGMPPAMGTGTGGAPNSGAAANPGAAPSEARSIAPNAQGVTGISGVSLSIGAAQDSVFTSPKHNVKLEGGTQMILKVQ
jgi:hypothetical protein